MAAPNRINFWTSPKGRGGVIFNPKNYVTDFGNFKQDFSSMELKQKSNFRVQDMFCIEKNHNNTHFEEGSSSHSSLRDGSGYKTDDFSESAEFLETAVDPHSGTPHPSEWPPSLAIMRMHFTLSGPRTSLYMFDHIHYKKNCYIIFPK